MARRIRVASVCYHNMPRETSRGLAAVLDLWGMLLDRAAWEQPDLILLPENFATAGLPPDKMPPAETPARGGPITDLLSAKARAHGAYILAGIRRGDDARPGSWNSAVLFDRQGAEAGHYDKTYPCIDEMEDLGICPGRGAVVFETDAGRLGAAICFDINFRELMAEYRRLGVDLLCFVSAFPAGFHLPSLAFENRWFVVSAVRDGRGLVADPLGRVVARSDPHAPGILWAELNLDGRVVHMDLHRERILALKRAYGRQVRIDAAGEEALYRVVSEHPDRTADAMLREFDIAPADVYLDRARAVRRRCLAADDAGTR